MTKRNSEINLEISVHNGMPHSIGLEADGQKITYPVDEMFYSDEGEPDPIRADVRKTEIGTLNFTAVGVPLWMPVDELKMMGLKNETRVREQIEAVQASDPDKLHVILVSPLAFAALRLAQIETEISEENPVGFGIPAGIDRDRNDEIRMATRIDQPRPKHLPPWDQNKVDSRRERLLDAGDYQIRASNRTPTDLEIGSIHLQRTLVTQPDYGEPNAISRTVDGTAITRPVLRQLWGEDNHVNAQFVHPRALPIARQLGKERVVGQSFMVHTERDQQGNLTNRMARLAVFHADTLENLARYAA